MWKDTIFEFDYFISGYSICTSSTIIIYYESLVLGDHLKQFSLSR